MINWSGFGYLVPTIGFGSLIITQLAVDAAFNDDNFYTNNSWPKLVGFLLAGVNIWFIGKHLNYRESTEVLDPDTQKKHKLIVTKDHSFFFIPFDYWPAICVLFGIIAFFL